MRKIFLLILIIASVSSCSQDLGPGYKFDLFKNTSNWNLAQALEKEDIKQIENLFKKDTAIKINLQESVYGNTLLNLCVGNDKLKATEILLLHGANFKIPDSLGFMPIHEVVQSIEQKKHSPEILKLLLKYGADPNQIALIRNNNGNKSNKYLPLMGAVESLECTKILLDHGGDLYYKDSLDYPIWSAMLEGDLNFSENIYVAKYIIIDKKMPIPNPIFYTIPNRNPRDIKFLLEKFDTHNDDKKKKAKDEILLYINNE